MRRTLLRFERLQQIVGGEGMAVIILTDMERKNAVSVVCDEPMSQQIQMRVSNPKLCKNMLPETLLSLLTSSYEMMICGLFEGQYQVVLMDDIGNLVRLRMSDAVLLSLMSDIPLYIENGLMERQCYPYDEKADSIAIPINTMDLPRLKMAMEKAVEDENYELASQLRDEINRRHHYK
ncbi:MAG: UvrB/UvrC motif-containing protein [Prevotella sp.]|nr:UvrB/UvrC motif-containing protein [Prevotella sp.]